MVGGNEIKATQPNLALAWPGLSLAIIVEIIFHVEIILHILQICQLFENYEEIITIYKVFITP